MYGIPIQDIFATEQSFGSLERGPSNAFVPDLDEYEEIIWFTSGGKDSLSCLLYLLDLGVPPSKIESHLHLVDGAEDNFIEWPVTRDYCRKVAEAFGLRHVESWRVGGFRREMLRKDAQTAPVAVPMPDGSHLLTGGERSGFSTRLRFPQQSANGAVRWCSGVTKIDVGSRYFTTNPRFQDGKKRLVVTGERAEESPCRANYEVFEPHRSDNRGGKFVDRYLDQWRAVHGFSEERVWALIEKYAVCAHPSYHLGLGRASCRRCVFAGPNQIATLKFLDPAGHEEFAQYERTFGCTIHRSMSIDEVADRGQVLPGARTEWGRIAMSEVFDLPVISRPWVRPIGAMSGENAGPT